MKEMTAMEEFAFNSDRVKQVMLDELLRERASLQALTIELQDMLDAERRMRQEAQNKLAVANSVIDRLTRNQ